jgi:hypothetical protein
MNCWNGEISAVLKGEIKSKQSEQSEQSKANLQQEQLLKIGRRVMKSRKKLTKKKLKRQIINRTKNRLHRLLAG